MRKQILPIALFAGFFIFLLQCKTETEPPIFLTYNGDPSTSIVIDWHIPLTQYETEGPAELLYRQQQGSEEHSFIARQAESLEFLAADRRIMRVELTGLQPDSTYEFRLQPEGRLYYFKTLADFRNSDFHEGRRSLRFAVGGDTRHRQSWMERTNRQIMAYEPDFIVWGGDLAYADGNPDNIKSWYEFFDACRTLIAEDGRVTPVVVGIGNHEMYIDKGGHFHFMFADFEDTEQWRAENAPYFFSLFAFPGQPGYDVIDFGDYLSLLILDSDHANPMDGQQLAWLEDALQQRSSPGMTESSTPASRHIIPVYHVPGYPSVRDFDLSVSVKVRELWSPLFERHGIRIAFEHHDHAYKRTVPILQNEEVAAEEGIVYVGDGAWGVRTREPHNAAETWYLAKAESARHGIIVELTGNRIDVTVVSENGQVIDEFSL